MKGNGKKKTALVLAAVMAASIWGVPAYAAENTDAAAPERSAASAPAGTDAGRSAGSGVAQKADESAAKVTKEQAEKLFRQYVSIPDDYTLQNAGYGTERLANGTRSYWNMYFVKRTNGKQVGSIDASLDAETGQLLSFNYYLNNPNAKPAYPLQVDREAARQLASEFIGQLAQDYVSEVQFNEKYGVQLLPPLSGEVTHSLRYDRLVNGIPFTSNYIELAISSEGHVQSFRLNWDNTIEFPEAGSYLSSEQAEAKLREAASPQLRYVMPYNAADKGKPFLSYQLPAIAIDAATGNKLEDRDLYYFRRGAASEAPLTERPLAARPQARQLSEADVIALVEEAFSLPESSELIHSGYNEYADEATGGTSSRWNLEWRVLKDGKEAGGVSASVNGGTGAVESFYQYLYGTGGSSSGESITLEEAVAKAEDVVKRQLPWLTHRLHLVKPAAEQFENRKPEEIGSYNIYFEHRVHGAVADYDHISVSIDAVTGEMRSFQASVSPVSYPAQAPSVIATTVAVDRWLDYYDIQLTYRLQEQYWLDGAPLPVEKVNVMLAAGEPVGDNVERKLDVQLVYQLVNKPRTEAVFLDALSGEWRNGETGEVTGLELPRATDAEGHWAEEPLQLMVAYRALDLQAGKVNPNQGITRGELIKMLVLARNSGRPIGYETASSAGMKASFNDVAADSAYFAYVESALEQNLIDLGDGSFNPEAPVTRDDMSELIVRALGYNSLANYDHIFKVSFQDADAIANKGQAAITVGLKIMSLTDGKFLPGKKVTRAEAATAFFRYLQKRAELQEAPLRM